MEPTVVLNGMTLSGVEPGGVRWSIPRDQIAGWWSSPVTRIEASDQARSHGSWVGGSWLNSRIVAISGYMFAPSNVAGEEAIDRLHAAATLAEGRISVSTDAGVLWAGVRRSDAVLVSWLYGQQIAQWSIQLLAADPRRFADALTATTGLPSTTGGLAVPFTLPAPISATVVSGQVSLFNPGNIAGPVSLRIDGPVTGPIVTHVTTGSRLVFASSLSLAAGEFVTVDMERREVLAQGQSARNGWVTSRGWSGFDPGDNTWAFTSSGVAAGGMLTVNATPAWM